MSKLRNKLRRRVERWLSDPDDYLRSIMDTSGFVSISTIASFPSLQAKTNPSDLTTTLSASSRFILSSDRTRVRLRSDHDDQGMESDSSVDDFEIPTDFVVMFDFKGTPLAKISPKKSEFYLARNIARIVSIKNTLTTRAIQLLIKPLGYDEGIQQHGAYTIGEEHENCVVCGQRETTKHHVVPYTYRKHFPYTLKCNQSFDVVNLCNDCHQKYEGLADLERDYIAEEYEVPLMRNSDPHVQWLRTVRNAAVALIKPGEENIPAQRKEELQSVVRRFVDQYMIETEDDSEREEANEHEKTLLLRKHQLSVPIDRQLLTTDFLSRLTSLSELKDIVGFKSHGRLVCEKLLEGDMASQMTGEVTSREVVDESELVCLDDLYSEYELATLETVHWQARFDLSQFPRLCYFIERWRGHFINTMHPRYLPKGWETGCGLK
ncbi:hypothetical protein P9112_005275 [Eukaryota sp. TZLM1-RC]